MARVLVACEFSGVVREAFLRRGHDAWSCDLLPAEDAPAEWLNQPQHYQCDVREVLHGDGQGPWDLMVAHPPCTFMANSGAKHLYLDGNKANGRNEKRWQQMQAGAEFFRLLWDAPIARICIENPVMVGHAKKLIGVEQTQTIQPWQFGHGETKATCLWLKNLPPLVPTKIVEGRTARVHRMAPGPDRWKERSRTFTGIAEAFADQWGALL